jgi:hypothetical protein
MTFRAATPASGYLCTNEKASLAFEAHGTASSSNPQHVAITSGTLPVRLNVLKAEEILHLLLLLQ